VTWAKLDDTFHHHPKLMEVGLAAVGLYARGISYATDNLTDGRLPERWVLGQMAGEDGTLADQLVEAGLWDRNGSGYLVHDYADYNPTREEVENRRFADSERKRSGIQSEASGTPGTGSSTSSATREKESKEFSEWLDHYRETTKRTSVTGSKPARDAFRARRREDYSLADLKLATIGCHGDDFCRENGHDIPETILRASKVTRYIELGRAPQQKDESGFD